MPASRLLGNLRDKRFSGTVLDLEFPSQDLPQIFAEFSRISGLRFDVDPSLPELRALRRFSLRGMPWDKSLDIVLGTCGLELRPSTDGLRVVNKGTGRAVQGVVFLAGAGFAAAAAAAALILRRRFRRKAARARLERKFPMKEERVAGIQKELERLFLEEKVYRDEDLDLKGLADRLSVPPHVLSWIFNAKLGCTFAEYLNRHRIREVREVLEGPGGRDRTILEIAFDAGFNTKSAFNRTFRKMTGTAPGAWHRRRRTGSP